jgi:hypothetical protein
VCTETHTLLFQLVGLFGSLLVDLKNARLTRPHRRPRRLLCPLHAGHLAALEAGRTQAQALGLTVLAGYLACAHDGHVHAKLGAESTAAEERWLAGSMRLAMCNAALWLRHKHPGVLAAKVSDFGSNLLKWA